MTFQAYQLQDLSLMTAAEGGGEFPMQAKIIETHRWCKNSRLRTLAIEGIPGTFSVNLANLEASLERAIQEWQDYTEVHYSKTWYVLEDKIMKFKGEISHTTYTRALPFDAEVVKQAIRVALQGHL
jgi:hypothetical protein